jgi:UMF1 family MFS transporter
VNASDSAALETSPGTSRGQTRQIAAWTLYDWANSSFTTIVVTFVYSAYFASGMVGDEVLGTAYWSRAISISAVFIAILSPILGAMADRGGKRRRFLVLSTLVCVVFTALLAFVSPSTPHAVLLALTLFVIANVAFEVGGVFYNAFLPVIAPPDRVGTVSGLGWGVGYTAGILSMVVALLAFTGIPGGPDPWLSLSTEGGFNVRAVNLLVAGWFLVFSLPMFLFVKDRTSASSGIGAGEALRELRRTFHEINRYRELVKFLLARLIYNDGLGTIFGFIGIFAGTAFGWDTPQVLIFGIAANITAGTGAFVFGFLDDRMGGKRTIMISIVALALGVILGVSTHSELWFWVAGLSAAVFAGPNQAASRSLMARFTPANRQAEFFGFYAFSGKVTTFAGPLLLGITTTLFDSVRIGMSTIAVFFIVGGLVLITVDENAGIRAAGGEAP